MFRFSAWYCSLRQCYSLCGKPLICRTNYRIRRHRLSRLLLVQEARHPSPRIIRTFGHRNMTSRYSVATRVIGPALPVVTIVASYLTLLALGFPESIATTLPFVHWVNVALICELATGAALVLGDVLQPNWRKPLAICGGILLTLAAFFGWSVAFSLVSYP